MAKHFIIVGILVVLVTIVTALVLGGVAGILPTQASEEAEIVDRLFGLEFYVIAFLFALIVVFMIYSVIVFRRRPGEEEEDGVHFHGNTRLEIIWTLIPLGIVLAFATIGAQYLSQIESAEADEMAVQVTGFQWDWRFEYPEYGVTSSELYLPADRQVRFEMTSEDVIHSFWVPEFRLKQDLVPGITTTLRIKPTKVGEYQLRCAEMCGTRHAYMLRPVRVVNQAGFENWIADQQAAVQDLGPVELGARLAQERGCISCHSLDGTELVGPTWQGLYNAERPLQSGETVIADEPYLHESIVNPNDKIVSGYPASVMPQDYEETLEEQEIEALIAYIKSLGEE